ncbi:hypothetical protein [Natronococcus sp.]|uniref:hypothetical protein n=1 Tax=Natronococcus sp. TaxID=35747 RepID=UPI003A4E51D7
MSYFTVALLDGAPVATLGPASRELPIAIEGRLDETAPVRLLFRSSRARSIATTLRGVTIPSSDLDNGAPSLAYSGRSFAQTRSSGRIVRVAYIDDDDELSATGILVRLRNAVGPGGPLVQELELLFYPMSAGSALYGPAGSVVDRIPDGTSSGSGS